MALQAAQAHDLAQRGPNRNLTLGTEGFGRSDTRAALQSLFGVDAASIGRATRHVLG